MENCVAPGLDEFDVIIRSCIVFSQSTCKFDEDRIKTEGINVETSFSPL